MHKITLESTIARAEGLLTTSLDDETILMSIDRGAYYGMEHTADRIWELIEKPRKVADICRQLAEEYSAAPEVYERDVISFLEELLEENLIVVA